MTNHSAILPHSVHTLGYIYPSSALEATRTPFKGNIGKLTSALALTRSKVLQYYPDRYAPYLETTLPTPNTRSTEFPRDRHRPNCFQYIMLYSSSFCPSSTEDNRAIPSTDNQPIVLRTILRFSRSRTSVQIKLHKRGIPTLPHCAQMPLFLIPRFAAGQWTCLPRTLALE